MASPETGSVRFAVVLYPVDAEGVADIMRGAPVGSAVEISDVTSVDEVHAKIGDALEAIASYVLIRQPWLREAPERSEA